MLINTVLIFLQNILPIFVVLSLLLAQQFSYVQNYTRLNKTTFHDKSLPVYLSVNRLFKISGVGLFITAILTYFMPHMSQLFNGAGLDVIYAILFILIYCLIVISFLSSQVLFYSDSVYSGSVYSDPKTNKVSIQENILSQASIVILLLVLSVHGSYFSFYVMSLTIQNTPIEALYTVLTSPDNTSLISETFSGVNTGITIGVIIGAGICLSISILMYFILTVIDKNIKGQVNNYFLLFFGVGQLMQAIPLLEQVDIISSNIQLWNTNSIISENSEIGYFLAILFGYEATPSAIQLIIYLSAILVPVLAVIMIEKISKRQRLKRSILHRNHSITSPRKGT